MPIDFPTSVLPDLKGDIEAITVQDPDIDKNTVLEIKKDWTVKVKWFVDGGSCAFLGGNWHLSVIVESMGGGTLGEKTLKKIDVPIHPSDAGPHVLNYDRDITIPASINALPGEESITEEGIYKLVVLLTYTTPADKVGRIAGFTEGPMIQFYNFEVPV